MKQLIEDLKCRLPHHEIYSAFLFGSSLATDPSNDVDLCIILNPMDSFDSFIDAVADVLLAVGEVFREFSIYPSLELSSFAVDLSRRQLHLLVYPDLSTFIRCESASLRSNVRSKSFLLEGDPPALAISEGACSTLSETHWDILVKIINSLVLMLNSDIGREDKRVLHARRVLNYCSRWMYADERHLSPLNTFEEFIEGYHLLNKDTECIKSL